ncbi:hypothetical protein SESBI_12771 [Sesbania bispinosa]|nr:hypothetical protein SESBI_12771 [Sesbania bispinosa]
MAEGGAATAAGGSAVAAAGRRRTEAAWSGDGTRTAAAGCERPRRCGRERWSYSRLERGGATELPQGAAHGGGCNGGRLAAEKGDEERNGQEYGGGTAAAATQKDGSNPFSFTYCLFIFF